MRSLALVTCATVAGWVLGLTGAAGCGAAPQRPVARGPDAAVTPARDLADARRTASPDPGARRDALPAQRSARGGSRHHPDHGAHRCAGRRARADLGRDRRSVPAGRRRPPRPAGRARRSRCTASWSPSSPSPSSPRSRCSTSPRSAMARATCRRPSRRCSELVDDATRTPASRSTATSTSRRSRPTTSSGPRPRRPWTRRWRATHLTFADRVEAFARRGLRRARAAPLRRRGGVAVGRGRRVAQGPADRRPVLHRDGALLPRRARASAVRRAPPVRTGDDEMVADLDAKRALAAQAYDRWREGLRLPPGLLGDRGGLPDVADLRRAVGGARQGAVPPPDRRRRATELCRGGPHPGPRRIWRRRWRATG